MLAKFFHEVFDNTAREAQVGKIVSIVEMLIDNPDFKEDCYWKMSRFKKGEKILEQGDDCNDLYLLKTGSARVLGSIETADNHRIQPGVCDIKSGDVFGELSLFDEKPRSASVECLEDCTAVVINGEKLLEYLEANPDIGFKFMQELMMLTVERLRGSNEKVFSLYAWGLKAHKIDEHLS